MNKNNQLAYNDSFLGFTDGRTALQTVFSRMEHLV